jgi:hypothetical protein
MERCSRLLGRCASVTAAPAPRLEVPADTREFTAEAFSRGWSDGLPVLHPTEDLVREFVTASGLAADFALGALYPSGAFCTVELLAVNAVMAGAPPESMPLLCAAVSAIADPSFDLPGVNTTTASVVPALVVSGPARDELGIPYRDSALGGAASPAPAIGRALRLVVRNVAGQVAGATSATVFGQPGRVTGIVTAEWEEESPWPSIGVRRGFPGSSVTAFGVLGTTNVIDTLGTDGREILQVVGKSLGFMGNNNMDKGSAFAHQLVALNPIWAHKVYADFPKMEDVQEQLYRYANIPIEQFPDSMRQVLQNAGKVRSGRVYLMDGPEDVSVIVGGGMGSLHAAMLPGMSNLLPVTRSLDPRDWPPSRRG